MKTLYKNIKTDKQAREKQLALESASGLKLTRYPTGEGFNFRPYIHAEILENSDYITQILSVLPKNSTGLSFTTIAEKTGLNIGQVLSNSKYLINNRLVIIEISRDNKIIGISKK